jgi:hypothetical protein
MLQTFLENGENVTGPKFARAFRNLTFQGTCLMGSNNKVKKMQALGGGSGSPPRQVSAVDASIAKDPGAQWKERALHKPLGMW